MRDWLPPEMLFLGTLSTPPFFLFTFFMITDPKTSPASRRGQIGVALAIALLDFGLNLVQSVFTFFYAAFIVQAARFAWAQVREMHSSGVRTRVRLALANRHFLRTAGVLVILATAGDSLYLGVLRPQVSVQDVGFTFHQIPAAQSGISVAMDRATLDLVDPRLRNVAKWLMSVGSSVAVADVNGDGLPDLFLVNPLARSIGTSCCSTRVTTTSRGCQSRRSIGSRTIPGPMASSRELSSLTPRTMATRTCSCRSASGRPSCCATGSGRPGGSSSRMSRTRPAWTSTPSALPPTSSTMTATASPTSCWPT
jgi:hypothetical protein